MDSASAQPPSGSGLGGLGVKFYRYRAIFKRQWWVLALTVVAGLAFEAWTVYKEPRKFESTTEISIREQLSIEGDSPKFQQEKESFVANTLAMLVGPEVLERARRNVALRYPQLAGTTPNVTPSVKAKTTIFPIKAVGTNPDLTQRYLDAVVAEFIDFRREQESGVVKGVANDISSDASKIQKDLTTAQSALQQFIAKNNMPFWTEQKQSRAQFLSGLKNREANLQSELQRLQNLTPDQLLSAPPPQRQRPSGAAENSTADTNASEPSSNGELYQMYVVKRQELSQAQGRLDERSKIWKPKHPKLQALKADVDQIQRSLDLIKAQNREVTAQRIDAIKAELRSLATNIETWEQKAREASEKDAEYQTLQQSVEHAQGMLKQIDLRGQSISGRLPDIFTILYPATPATEVPKEALMHLLTGLLAGFVAGAVILILLDRADDRLASSTETMERFTESILGQIPDVADSRVSAGLPLLQPDDERFTYAEAFRSLRSSLIFMPNQGEMKTLLVTSAIPNEGKSTIASNLAITMSAAGARVVLVDADIRRGDLASLFDIDGRTGLSNILRGEITWESAVRKTAYPTLTVIPRGPVTNQSSELLLLPTVNVLLDALKSKFDLVLFNTAPILATDDTPTLAPHFDGALMVMRAEFTSSRLTQNALSALYQRQVKVLGLVLNCVDAEVPDYYYYRYPKYYAA